MSRRLSSAQLPEALHPSAEHEAGRSTHPYAPHGALEPPLGLGYLSSVLPTLPAHIPEVALLRNSPGRFAGLFSQPPPVPTRAPIPAGRLCHHPTSPTW